MAITYPLEWRSLKFPAKRAELIEYLSEIAMAQPNSSPSLREFSIDEIVHFFFDDTNLSDQSSSSVGDILFDDAETILVHRVTAAIDAAVNQLRDRDSRAYLAHSAWPEIQLQAQIALETIRSRGVPLISS